MWKAILGLGLLCLSFLGCACDDTPGKADSYVLALNWFPGFCHSKFYNQAPADCDALRKGDYAADNLSLHGLWPNQTSCGTNYGYCQTKARSSFCAYPPLELSKGLRERLLSRMPSSSSAVCLDRHEWNKHGTCQILTPEAYFNLGVRLTEEFNQTPLANAIRQAQGESISLAEVRDAIVASFGKHALSQVVVGCQHSVLVEVQLSLPALIPLDSSLRSLVEQAEPLGKKSSCPSRIKIIRAPEK